MDNITKMENFMGVKETNGDILGKFLYFSLSNILIDRQMLAQICEDMNLPVRLGPRLGAIGAFKSATSDIYERIVNRDSGELKVSKVYCRDNHNNGAIHSREMVEEILEEKTNRYRKLANLYYDSDNDRFDYAVDNYSSKVDPYKYCTNAHVNYTNAFESGRVLRDARFQCGFIGFGLFCGLLKIKCPDEVIEDLDFLPLGLFISLIHIYALDKRQ